MRIAAVHTCPLWERPDGSRYPGMRYDPDPPPVVGWVNVMALELYGERYLVMLTLDATR